MLHALNAPLTPVQVTLPEGKTLSWLPLDLDVSPFDNSHTRKEGEEGVSPTYKKVEGYAPFFAYLGQEGYGINVNLREVRRHVQKEAAAFLSHSLDYARRITDSPLLVRMVQELWDMNDKNLRTFLFYVTKSNK